MDDNNVSSDEFLENIRFAKEKMNIPIIGSLNRITTKGWIDYSKLIEPKGADVLWEDGVRGNW